MSRRAVWLQLLIGWLPMWALFAALILVVHEGTDLHAAVFLAFRGIAPAILLGFAVQRFTERFPWPNPVRFSFVVAHVAAAIIYAFAWFVLNSVVESIMHMQLVIVYGVGFLPFITLGVWLYVMIAGVSYTLQSNERAAHAETAAAQAQLSALRGQINPHFLFNALHTVVQLIPIDPATAAQAAEKVAALLRTTLEEDRDIISLGAELDFVERYLDVEHIRFGDRLRIHLDVDDETRNATLPSFAIQTLVENAIRHGAAPRVEPTDLTISAEVDGALHVAVTDTGVGYVGEDTNGTGLRRLRERLAALYGSDAHLEIAARAEGGTLATLIIPQGVID